MRSRIFWRGYINAATKTFIISLKRGLPPVYESTYGSKKTSINSKQIISVINQPILEIVIGKLKVPKKLKNNNKKIRTARIAEYWRKFREFNASFSLSSLSFFCLNSFSDSIFSWFGGRF